MRFSVDWGVFVGHLTERVRTKLQGAVDGAEEDIRTMAADITDSLGQAIILRDSEKRDMLLEQLDMLAEKHRIVARDNFYYTMDETIENIFGVAVDVLRSAGDENNV